MVGDNHVNDMKHQFRHEGDKLVDKMGRLFCKSQCMVKKLGLIPGRSRGNSRIAINVYIFFVFLFVKSASVLSVSLNTRNSLSPSKFEASPVLSSRPQLQIDFKDQSHGLIRTFKTIDSTNKDLENDKANEALSDVKGSHDRALNSGSRILTYPIHPYRTAAKQETYRRKRLGRSTGPSLSIVNPLDVLRQRLLLEIARRRQQKSNDQIKANEIYLQTIG